MPVLIYVEVRGDRGGERGAVRQKEATDPVTVVLSSASEIRARDVTAYFLRERPSPPRHAQLVYRRQTSIMSDWQTIQSAYRSKRDAKIPVEWRLPGDVTEPLTEESTLNVLPKPSEVGIELGILTSREVEITASRDASDLVLQLSSRIYTALEVVTAFSKRAAISHQLVCIVAH